jgi:predicted nucleotidyltransferase component of viral defense system
MIDLVQEKLRSYGATNRLEEENATKEIMQEIALYALWKADFFERAVFQGGTSLRILHGLPRFSEDLDFMLLAPDRNFNWAPYLSALMETFATFGIRTEARSKDDMDKRIRAALIKDTSIAGQLDLAFADRQPDQKIKIKLEIDVDPPASSKDVWTFLDFPADYEVRHQDLSSNFALKIHALLCRRFLKGRDWYDFSWYVANGVFPNLPHLETALFQYGPWAGQKDLQLSRAWLSRELGKAIDAIDWDVARSDVRRFVRPGELKSLDLWSARFFFAKLSKMIASSH